MTIDLIANIVLLFMWLGFFSGFVLNKKPRKREIFASVLAIISVFYTIIVNPSNVTEPQYILLSLSFALIGLTTIIRFFGVKQSVIWGIGAIGVIADIISIIQFFYP